MRRVFHLISPKFPLLLHLHWRVGPTGSVLSTLLTAVERRLDDETICEKLSSCSGFPPGLEQGYVAVEMLVFEGVTGQVFRCL